MSTRQGYASLGDDQVAGQLPSAGDPSTSVMVTQGQSGVSPIPHPVAVPVSSYAVTATGDYQSVGDGIMGGPVGGAGGGPPAGVTAAGLPSFQQQGPYASGAANGAIMGPPVYSFYPDPNATVVVDIPPPQRPVPPDTDFRFCSLACCSTFSRWFGMYIALIAVSILIYFVVEPVGLLCLAVTPAVTILSFLEMRFRRSVIRVLMVITFFITVLWMIPIVILENVADYFFVLRHHLPEGGTCGKCILAAFLTAYLIAGLFEESIKYLAVRRLVTKDYVVDPRALVVYSCCAGAAFGTIEDVLYAFQFGVAPAVVRAFTAVPLHCATGLVIGTNLAEKKFFNNDKERWYKTLILPILVHGTYDFILIISSSSPTWAAVGFAAAISIVMATYVYVRCRVLWLLSSFPTEVDVHEKLQNGEIMTPSFCCFNRSCCPSCYY